MNIEAAERETYATIWGAVEQYGTTSPGEKHVPMFMDIASPKRGATVLDAGCGNGKAAIALSDAGFRVTMCDITDEGLLPEARTLTFARACLWHPIPQQHFNRYDYVFCADVLEHLPTAYTMLAVSRMIDAAKRGVFLSVGTTDDLFGFWIGKPLHQTVQPFTWWRDHLSGVGKLVVARDLISSAVFYLT